MHLLLVGVSFVSIGLVSQSKKAGGTVVSLDGTQVEVTTEFALFSKRSCPLTYIRIFFFSLPVGSSNYLK